MTDDEILQDVNAAIRIAAACPCLMCSSPSDGAALFLPDDRYEFDGKPGSELVIFVALCEPCSQSTTAEEREHRLLESWGRAA